MLIVIDVQNDAFDESGSNYTESAKKLWMALRKNRSCGSQ